VQRHGGVNDIFCKVVQLGDVPPAFEAENVIEDGLVSMILTFVGNGQQLSFIPAASGVRTPQQVQRHKRICKVVSAVAQVCDVRLKRS